MKGVGDLLVGPRGPVCIGLQENLRAAHFLTAAVELSDRLSTDLAFLGCESNDVPFLRHGKLSRFETSSPIVLMFIDGTALERFLLRIVFCLFADDTGIFEPRGIFLQLIEERTAADGTDLGPRIARLFHVLNTPPRIAVREPSTRTWTASPTSTAICSPKRCASQTSTPRCVRPCSRRANSAGRRSCRPSSARCSSRSWSPPTVARKGRLHDREEHPEGHRAAVPRRSAGRVPAAPGAQGRARH